MLTHSQCSKGSKEVIGVQICKISIVKLSKQPNKMRKTQLIIAAMLVAGFATAQSWTLDKAHSNLGFTITHLIVQDVDGTFNDVSINLTSSKDDFSDAKVEMTANVASINTSDEKRDKHLKEPDFFEVDKYPTLNFKSSSFKKVGENSYEMKGDLTMHGVTKPIVLNVALKGKGMDPYAKKPMAGFKIQGKLKRTDFNIGKGTPSAIVGDEVEIKANIAVWKS